MHPLGSVFIQTLCDLLEEDKGCDLEITRLMTRLSYQVAYHFQARGRELKGKKEMPCFASRLTREVYPFRASQSGKPGITALPEDSHRIRKRSISWGKLLTAPEQIPLLFRIDFFMAEEKFGFMLWNAYIRTYKSVSKEVSWVQLNVKYYVQFFSINILSVWIFYLSLNW